MIKPNEDFANVGRTTSVATAVEPRYSLTINRGSLEPVAQTAKRLAVLMIDAFYPRPDHDSGSLDQISFIQIFQNLGYDIYYIAAFEFAIEHDYKNELQAKGVCCISAPQYVSINDFLERNAKNISFTFLSRVHCARRYVETIRRACPSSRIIFNTVDLHHLRERRRAELTGDSHALESAQKIYVLEVAATKKSDATIVFSDYEATYWRREVPTGRIFTVPLIRNYEVARQAEFSARDGIGFIGGFQHKPNVDAVIHFLDDIWPRIQAILPDTTFYVIGSNMPKSLSSRSDARVSFIGYVEDIEPWLSRLRLTVAPLRYGAGAKGKVVSSLAHGVPCISSNVAVEGMGLHEGIDIEIGADPADFARKTCDAYTNEGRWMSLSDNGMSLIRRRYSIERGTEIVRSIILAVGAAFSPGPLEK